MGFTTVYDPGEWRFAAISPGSVTSAAPHSVCRVPESCGVKAFSHFMRQFKTHTGMTMLQYRRRK